MPNQRNGLLASVPPGSKNQAKAQRIPQEPGRPCRLLTFGPEGATGNQPQACPCRARQRRERNPEHTLRYGQTKETKCGRRDDRASEHSIVPSKPGNSFRKNPVEGRGCRVRELLEGNMAGASK